MSVVVQMPTVGEPKERRLHLRDVADAGDGLTVGQLLRARRESLGLDERAIANRLCIRRDQVVAIETGDHSRLPGRPYALGFVRSYAQALGLDAAPVVARFKAEALALDPQRLETMTFPDTAPQPGLPVVRLAGGAVLAAGIVYMLVQLLWGAPAEPPLAVAPEEGAVTVVEPAIVPPAAPVPVAMTPPASSVVAPPVAAPVAAETSPAPVLPASRIKISATEAAYLEVKDPALTGPDSVLVARELVQGESFDVPDRAGLVLLTGNAGGLQVAVDGGDSVPLGQRGQVIRKLVLDPAYFLSRPATSR